MHTKHLVAVALLGALSGMALPVRAAGPLIVNGSGQPLVWQAPVPFNPDRGSLGRLDNAAAVAAVVTDFAVWGAVPTASIGFHNAGLLSVDVTVANVLGVLGQCDGLSPIVFDDGSITDMLLGSGASDVVLGFATPACGSYDPPIITEGEAVLNGKFIDGIDNSSNPEITVSDFNAVFVHEFGHYLNLAHAQLNLDEAFDGEEHNDEAVPTMFPILVNGAAANTLHLDDRVSLSALYPAPGLATGFGRITGHVVESDGSTPFQGANVIARRVDDPLLTAVSMVSGSRFFPDMPEGPPAPDLEGLYELPGLPAGSYTVEIEEVDRRFDGGSGVGPIDPPRRLPGPPEFWNGADEGPDQPPDDPAAATPLGVSAGGTIADIDIVMNTVAPPPNDACAAATPVTALPFNEQLDTSHATAAPSDPVQACTGGRNSATVWYRFTSPVTATVVAQTVGSAYDTVLSAHSGSCDALVERACSDDAVNVQSRIELDVAAGETVMFEVSGFGGGGGGDLTFQIATLQVYDGIAPDPIGDTLGSGPVQLDVTALAVCRDGDETRIELTFATPISPGDSGRADAIAGYVDLDVDQDGSTGFPSSVDEFAGLPTGLGVEYAIDLFSTTATGATLLNAAGATTVPVEFSSTSLLIRVPLGALAGDDGLLDAASIVGTSSEPTDGVPNGGRVRSAASCVTSTLPPTTTTTTTTLVPTTTTMPSPVCQPGSDCDGDVCTVGDVCTTSACIPGARLDGSGFSAWLRDGMKVSECDGIRRAGRVTNKLGAAAKAVDSAEGTPPRKHRRRMVAASKRIDEGRKIAKRNRKKLGADCHATLVERLAGAVSRMGCLE